MQNYLVGCFDRLNAFNVEVRFVGVDFSFMQLLSKMIYKMGDGL